MPEFEYFSIDLSAESSGVLLTLQIGEAYYSGHLSHIHGQTLDGLTELGIMLAKPQLGTYRVIGFTEPEGVEISVVRASHSAVFTVRVSDNGGADLRPPVRNLGHATIEPLLAAIALRKALSAVAAQGLPPGFSIRRLDELKDCIRTARHQLR